MIKMPRRLLLIVFAGALAACSKSVEMKDSATLPLNSGVPVAQLIEQADQNYAQRDNLGRVRDARNLLRDARKADYNNYDVAWKLAKVNYYLGDHTTDANEKLAAFQEGIAMARAAVALQSQRPEGHFWLGANLGGQASAKGIFGGLSNIPEIRREMETVIKLDDKFEGGSAYLALGQVDLEVPESMGGNQERAVAELEKGVSVDGENTELRIELAQAYLAAKRTDDARKQLNALLAIKPDPAYLPEYKETVEKAREMLKKMA